MINVIGKFSIGGVICYFRLVVCVSDVVAICRVGMLLLGAVTAQLRYICFSIFIIQTYNFYVRPV